MHLSITKIGEYALQSRARVAALHYAGIAALQAVKFSRYWETIADCLVVLNLESGNIERAEKLLLGVLKRRRTIRRWSVTTYCSCAVSTGKDRIFDALTGNLQLRQDLKALLTAAKQRRDGDLDGALRSLEISSTDQSVRARIVNERRSIHQEMRNHLALAVEGAQFLATNKKPQIKFAIATAGSAETAQREDIFSFALNRLFNDMTVIRSGDRRTFFENWEDAWLAAVTVFDMDAALQILDRADAEGIRSSRSVRADTLNMLREFSDQTTLIEAARDDFRARAKSVPVNYENADAIIVLPSAVFRENKIAYPEFRSDLRFVVSAIARALLEQNVAYYVRGRIRTHGEVNFNVPSFSYHTMSTSRNGLHWKETDRRRSFSFDCKGYAGWSDFSSLSLDNPIFHSVDANTSKRFFRDEQARVIGKNLSKYDQPGFVDIKLPERYIFIPLQVMGDAVAELSYMSPFEMMDEVIATARRFGVSVVVKRHPLCKSPQITAYLDRQTQSDQIVVATASIHSLIAGSDAVCVINSGVGAEALLHEKPVYVFGRSDYMQACIVCSAPGDFSEKFEIGRPHTTAPRLHAFWYVFRTCYSVSVADREEAEKMIGRKVRSHLSNMGNFTRLTNPSSSTSSDRDKEQYSNL